MAFKINFDTNLAGKGIDRLGAKVDKVKRKVDALNRASAQVSKVGESSRALRRQVSQMAVGVQTLQKSTKSLGDQVTGVSLAQTELAKSGGILRTSAGKNTKSMREFSNEMNTTSKRAAALRAGMYATGTHFGAFTAQTILAATATYLVVKSFASMIQVGAQFEQSMTRANAVMGNYIGNSTELNSNAAMLENQVRKLGKETVFTVGEVAEGLVFLGMAGLSASEANKALKPVLDIASIGIIDMAKAADIATNIMLGFGKNAGDLTNIVDVMAVAITSSNMDMLQLGNSLSYVAPVAAATNNSLKDTVAILEIFHNVGIKSSRAGTSLRRAMINLSKPTEKVQTVLNKLGVALYDQTGKMRPLVNIMRQFADANANVSDITTIFGARAAPAMIAFYRDLRQELDGTVSQFGKFRKELEESNNQAEILRDRIEKTLSADWKKMVSALSELALQIFDVLVPGLKGAVTWATALFKVMDGRTIVGMVTGMGALTAVMYGLPALFAALSTRMIFTHSVTRGLTAAVGWLSLAFKNLNPWLKVLGFATAAVGAFYILKGKEFNLATRQEKLDANRKARLQDFVNLKKELNAATTEGIRNIITELNLKSEIAFSEEKAAQSRALAAQQSLAAAKKVYENAGTRTKGRAKLRVDAAIRVNTQAMDNLARATLDADLATDKLVAGRKALGESVTGDKERAKNLATAIAKTRELFNLEKLGVTTYKDKLQVQKNMKQEALSAIDRMKAIGESNPAQVAANQLTVLENSAKQTKATYGAALDDLKTRIGLFGTTFEKFLKDKDKAGKLDSKKGVGITDVTARQPEILKLREEYDALREKNLKNTGASDKEIANLKSSISSSATTIRRGLLSQIELEQTSFDSKMAMLDTNSSLERDMIEKNNKAKEELQSRHNLKMAQLYLDQVSSVTQPLGEYFQTSYNMAYEASQRQWDLTKEAESRKEKFQEAARNSQSAGDRQYYQNIANQYKSYEQAYKQGAVNADKVARKRFEQNKTAQIANTIINTASAAMKAYEQGGMFAAPAAAAITLAGAKAVSAIRAQEYSSPGGGDAFSGSFGGLPSSADSRDSISDTPRSDRQGSALSVYIEGAITEEMITDVVLPVLRDGINDRDLVLISGSGADSAQLSELQGNQ